MKRAIIVSLVAVGTLALLGTGAAISQAPKGKDRELDKQHEDLLRDFAGRAHRLALQYEQAGAHDKAKSTLELILQLLPNDAQAKSLLDKITTKELTENKTTLKVQANQSWQDTGLLVVDGKPVAIEAKGKWVFKMSREVTAEGIEMPDELRKFPLGALIGVIDTGTAGGGGGAAKKDGQGGGGRPFLIGSEKVFTPNATGVLWLKMHDSEESDNVGQLTVTISGQVRER